jgi:NADH-quinone oxidoreductase subunit C
MKSTLEQLTAQFTALIGPAPVALVPAQPAASAVPAAAATASAPVAAAPKPPVQTTDFALKGFVFDATVAPAQVVAAAAIMERAGFGLDAVTGVDWIAQNEMEVVYDFFHPEVNFRAVYRTRVPRTTPELPTISPVFPGANWHERETHEFFGIRFLGHPNLTPLLLPEDATFHPLRKDYQP